MPNQMPYGFYNPSINNGLYDNYQNNYDFNMLMELQERVKVLEKKVKALENSNNTKDDYNYKFDYTSGMHMM